MYRAAGIACGPETAGKEANFLRREGRVCAGNPGRVSCAISINGYQNFFKVLIAAGIACGPETAGKEANFLRREGRVCAGNSGRVSCAISINGYQNFFKVLIAAGNACGPFRLKSKLAAPFSRERPAYPESHRHRCRPHLRPPAAPHRHTGSAGRHPAAGDSW